MTTEKSEIRRRRIVGDWLSRRLDDLAHEGKTRKGLADALGLPKARITEMTKGTRRIQSHEIEPLARYLECPPQIISALAAGSITPIMEGLCRDPSTPDAGGATGRHEKILADWHARFALDMLLALPPDLAESVIIEAAARIGARQRGGKGVPEAELRVKENA